MHRQGLSRLMQDLFATLLYCATCYVLWLGVVTRGQIPIHIIPSEGNYQSIEDDECI